MKGLVKCIVLGAVAVSASAVSASSPFGPSVADDLIAGQLRLLRRLQQDGN